MIQATDAAHPFRTACLEGVGITPGVAAGIQEAVEYGRCPRCMEKLPERPAGSHATRCRCVPLCSDCSVEELQPETYVEPGSWPLPLETRLSRRHLRREAETILENMDRDEHEDAQHGRPEYRKSDAALDALAMLQAFRIKAEEGEAGADALRGLWDTIHPDHRLIVASTLAGWVVTMNGLTAISFDTWANQIRAAALHMRDEGQ